MNKLAWRRTWFQVHKWLGLALAILIIPLSLSGAALVWDHALDKLINPSRYAVSGSTVLTSGRYVAATRARLGADAAIAQLTFPDDAGPVVVAVAPATPTAKPRPGPPARTMIYLDPPTARILAVADSRSGLVRTLHMLHGSLLVPGVGRQIVGWIGVAMMVSCFTGLWLWWPTASRWVRGLRWRRHRNTDTNLHYLTGFWVALPLFVLSLTGAWISFPAFFGTLVGETPRGRGPDRAAMMRARPLAHPALTADAVVATSREPARGALRSITWPTDRSADWSVAFARGAVTVADDSGIAAPAPDRRPRGVAGLMRRIHDGDGMGGLWQAIIFVGGVIPALLGVTGFIMWWRARTWRGELAAKRRAKIVVAPVRSW